MIVMIDLVFQMVLTMIKVVVVEFMINYQQMAAMMYVVQQQLKIVRVYVVEMLQRTAHKTLLSRRLIILHLQH